MSKSKNSSFAIGAFIVGALILIFVALLFFSGGKYFSEKEKVIMYFEGSVQGLQVGAPVKLKGVELGQITDIQINFQSDNKTIVNAVTADLVLKRINSKGARITNEFFDEAIKNGLRAQLNFQSFLTGLLYVELDFYPDTPVKLYGLQQNTRELPTVATQFEELSKSFAEMDIKGIARHIDEFAIGLNNIVKGGEIQTTIKNINKAAVSIEKTSNNVNTRMTQLSQNIEVTRGEIDKLLAELNKQTPEVAKALNKSLQDLSYSLEQVNKTAASIDGAVSENSPLINQLNSTLSEINRSALAFRNLTETLEQQPEALLRGKNIPNKDK
ncbi:MlaD family protein [Cellvibrio sp.]|uniref:MlaD family protein n=1 Tax=Cellvibrio sp. TaxID=1965322 RepID=UPI0039647C11